MLFIPKSNHEHNKNINYLHNIDGYVFHPIVPHGNGKKRQLDWIAKVVYVVVLN